MPLLPLQGCYDLGTEEWKEKVSLSSVWKRCYVQEGKMKNFERHGIWEPDPCAFVCSECHKWLIVEKGNADMNFCPHCGARMDGGNEDE